MISTEAQTNKQVFYGKGQSQGIAWGVKFKPQLIYFSPHPYSKWGNGGQARWASGRLHLGLLLSLLPPAYPPYKSGSGLAPTTWQLKYMKIDASVLMQHFPINNLPESEPCK